MIIKEYRVTMPLTVEEYQIGQLYSVAEASLRNTGGGDGVEVLKNEPFSNYPLLNGQFDSGQYTHKIYHLGQKIPSFLRLILPKNVTDVHEEAWNAYPYCKTVITNPGYMKNSFFISIETMHFADNGQQHNIHHLSPEKLKLREVVPIDIANDPVSAKDYKQAEDPKLFTSKLTGRGPLGANWKETANPVMTCYKLVTCEFKFMGLQNKVENLIQSTERRLFLNFHRQAFCTIDNWIEKTIEDIRRYEAEIQMKLDEQRRTGEVRGYANDT